MEIMMGTIIKKFKELYEFLEKHFIYTKMFKTFKYRIFPDQVQKDLMSNIFGCVRFVYNLGLETKIEAWTSAKKSYSCIDLTNQMKELKDTKAPWLAESPSQALQYSLRNLDNAYTNFFKRGVGFPKFKNKHGKQSFSLPQGVRLSENNKNIFIPKLKWVDIDMHRELCKGEIKTVTVSRTVTDKYFVSILLDTKEELPMKKLIDRLTSVGVDLGIKDFCITSDGEKFDNKDFLKSKMQELRRAQRNLARKKKGSNHYQKQKIIVALLHEKVRNQRRDYLHKISSYLVNKYDTICLEDLAVKNMVKNHCLARAISDQGWSEFRTFTEYKADWKGKNISIIGRFEPSSKICSCCGKLNKELTLADRIWTCIGCKTVHDRDVNAANNINNFGLRDKPGVAQSDGLPCACNV